MTPKLITSRLILREIKGNDLFGYYEIRSDTETMQLFGGPILTNDFELKNFVEQMKLERENGISYFWSIVLKEEKEFIGFIRLMSYKSNYYDASFSVLGEHKFDSEFLKYFDRENGWEIDYALFINQRNKGIMKEAVGAVLEFCQFENINPVYAKVNHMTNIATVSVLKYHKFQDHLPQIDQTLLEKYDIETIFKNNEFGMIYKLTL